MSRLLQENSSFLKTLRTWRARLAPILGAAILGVFLYWIWIYRQMILATFEKLGWLQMVVLLFMLCIGVILSALAFAIPIQDMGYRFGVADGYHTLNLSQLASMIPGGVWGYAGLAAVLWSKGISKADSVVVIFFYTVIMLSACAIVGITGLAAILGWGYAAICLVPFLFLILGRNWLDRLRQRYYPDSSPLPSINASLRVLMLGLVVWIISAVSFTWLLYRSAGYGIMPFWTIAGAYSAGYLGGYISIFAPSGLGVSEGLVSLLLGPYIGTAKVMAVAISFRIILTAITWCNVLVTFLLSSRRGEKRTID